MAARSDQAEFQRVRWSLYLELQLAHGVPSRAKLAEALDLPTSRISQWIAGERGVEASTAYDVGELLRARFELPTSGCDALYAAGCFTDLVRLLRAASYDETDGALERVVARYATLPAAFLSLEIEALATYERTLHHYRTNEFETHETARLRRDDQIARALAQSEATRTLAHEASRLLRSPQAQRQFARAWHLAQRPLEIPRVVMLPPVARAIAPGTSAASPAPAATPTYAGYAADIEPLAPPPVEAISALAEVVIALARALETRNPSLTAPRLWRMLAEWAFELDPAAYERYAPLLPETYAHFATHRPA
jgi:hypothetical protein